MPRKRGSPRPGAWLSTARSELPRAAEPHPEVARPGAIIDPVCGAQGIRGAQIEPPSDHGAGAAARPPSLAAGAPPPGWATAGRWCGLWAPTTWPEEGGAGGWSVSAEGYAANAPTSSDCGGAARFSPAPAPAPTYAGDSVDGAATSIAVAASLWGLVVAGGDSSRWGGELFFPSVLDDDGAGGEVGGTDDSRGGGGSSAASALALADEAERLARVLEAAAASASASAARPNVRMRLSILTTDPPAISARRPRATRRVISIWNRRSCACRKPSARWAS